MKKAARAIIIKGDSLLTMHRNKYGSEYFTLVGGRANEDETMEQALVREVKEETGLDVAKARLVFIEEHAAPYNQQYIYLCEVAPFKTAEVQADSEEGFMNRLEANTHKLAWVNISAFERLQFRTPQLQQAIVHALKHGFPTEPQRIDDLVYRKPTQKKSIFGRIRRR